MKRKESNRKLKAKQTGNTTSRYKKQKTKKKKKALSLLEGRT